MRVPIVMLGLLMFSLSAVSQRKMPWPLIRNLIRVITMLSRRVRVTQQRSSMEVADLAGQDAAEIEQFCRSYRKDRNVADGNANGLDLSIVQEVFSAVDGSEDAREKDGFLNDSEEEIFTKALDIISYCEQGFDVDLN